MRVLLVLVLALVTETAPPAAIFECSVTETCIASMGRFVEVKLKVSASFGTPERVTLTPPIVSSVNPVTAFLLTVSVKVHNFLLSEYVRSIVSLSIFALGNALTVTNPVPLLSPGVTA